MLKHQYGWNIGYENDIVKWYPYYYKHALSVYMSVWSFVSYSELRAIWNLAEPRCYMSIAEYINKLNMYIYNSNRNVSLLPNNS